MAPQLSRPAPDFGDRLVRFEAEWNSGQVPDIASYIRDVGDGDSLFIEDLIEIDLEFRWKQFHTGSDLSAKDPHGFPLFPQVDDYASILPRSLQRPILAPQCVAEEYRVRSRWGDKPNKRCFFERFPSERTEIEAALHQIDTEFENEGVDFPQDSSLSVAEPAEATFILGKSGKQKSSLVPEAELIGTTIGKYRLESRLGHGAFGEVWKAYDPALKRQVAVKFPRSDKQFSPALLQTFRTEAQKLAKLDHVSTGIVDVYDCGEHEGKPYFVSKLIEGESLAHRMQRENLTHEESARLIAKVAETLKRAHREKLVHRDIKPGNILLDKVGEPYLADFGMAATEDERLTERGGILGTFAYMAPEQACGDSHRADGRADIYALGVLLYLLLTNELPYGGKTTEQFLDSIQHQKPRPPRQIDESIPPELERICLKCLKKNQDERYSSAGDLARDLKLAVGQRNRRKQAAVLALCLILIILGSGIAWRSLGLTAKAPELPESNPEPGSKRHDVARTWYRLFDHAPVEVHFPTKEPASHWHYDSHQEYLAANSQNYGLFLVESTDAMTYRLQVSISRNGFEHGVSGLILGYQDQPNDEFETLATCQIIVLKCVDNKSFRIERAAMKIKQQAGQETAYEVYSFDSEEIPALDFREGVLEVFVSKGKLDEIRWNNQALKSLTGGRDPGWLEQLGLPLHTTGRIGLINGFEDATFRDFRYMFDY